MNVFFICSFITRYPNNESLMLFIALRALNTALTGFSRPGARIYNRAHNTSVYPKIHKILLWALTYCPGSCNCENLSSETLN
jgi:hypothetical protein